MTTRADVINEALVACDQPEATGPNDASTWVQRIRNRYNASAKKLLERHPWNFASQRVELAALDTTPTGRTYAYNKPGDCLRICIVNSTGRAADNSEPDYEDEAGQILADMTPCYLFYISANWLTLEGSWPQVFADAVALDLAAKCYGLFGKSAEKKDELKKDAAKALQVAKSWDAAQKPYRRLPRGRWAAARGGARSPLDRGGTFED